MVQHLLAVSDSNRDPLKDASVRLASWRTADPQCCLMIRVGVRTGGNMRRRSKKEKKYLALSPALRRGAGPFERNSDDGG